MLWRWTYILDDFLPQQLQEAAIKGFFANEELMSESSIRK